MAPDFLPDPAWLMPGNGYLIDFLIALVFFTAVTYAVLGRRLGHRRAAAAASAALGFALSLAMVAWEVQTGRRIADLGPIAVGLAVIVLALVVYHTMRQIGGRWAGVLTAVGAAALIGQVLSLPGLSNLLNGVVLPLAGIGLMTAGLIRLMHDRHTAFPSQPVQGVAPWGSRQPSPSQNTTIQQALDDQRDLEDTKQQVHAIDDIHRITGRIEETLRQADRMGKELPAQPELARLIRRQLDSLLPASQEITRRLAQLRSHTELVRRGHLGKIRRLAPQVPKLDPRAAREASKELRDVYEQASLGQRLDRLDRAAVLTQQRITQTVEEVRRSLDAARYHEAASSLHRAQHLGHQARKLIDQIDKQYKHILKLAIDAARQARKNEAAV